MTRTLWFLIIGALLIMMALLASLVKRLPLSMAMLYLLIGAALGPLGAGLLRIDAIGDSAVLEPILEVGVLVSLFSAGLKLRAPVSALRWKLPIRLAVGAMLISIVLLAPAGAALLGLPLGAAILLGAILAPTDPVLASDVQVEHPGDEHEVRFALTGEAGLNDGIAFPFVMLGLGVMGLHGLGPYGARWLGLDVVWGLAAGLAVGWLLGTALGRLVIHLRRTMHEAVGLDEFLGLGLLALSYGVSLLVHGYGFLAVFIAGMALRRVERKLSGGRSPQELVVSAEPGAAHESATDPKDAPAYMAWAVLSFNERLERVVEVALVLVIGAMVPASALSLQSAGLAALLFLVVRPVSVMLVLTGTGVRPTHRYLMAWFGIRGIGSVYYLMFAAQHGLPAGEAQGLADVVLGVVAASIVAHGVSATPLMRLYSGMHSRRPTAR
jgi:sodium/hydrogen antiporter